MSNPPGPNANPSLQKIAVNVYPPSVAGRAEKCLLGSPSLACQGADSGGAATLQPRTARAQQTTANTQHKTKQPSYRISGHIVRDEK